MIKTIKYLIVLFPNYLFAQTHETGRMHGIIDFIESRMGLYLIIALAFSAWALVNKNANRGLGVIVFIIAILLTIFRVCIKIFDM